jgi:hypothetical protein
MGKIGDFFGKEKNENFSTQVAGCWHFSFTNFYANFFKE